MCTVSADANLSTGAVTAKGDDTDLIPLKEEGNSYKPFQYTVEYASPELPTQTFPTAHVKASAILYLAG